MPTYMAEANESPRKAFGVLIFRLLSHAHQSELQGCLEVNHCDFTVALKEMLGLITLCSETDNYKLIIL